MLCVALTFVGCACKKYEMALADLDKSVIVVENSLGQTMDLADSIAGDDGPLFDARDREARLRTCWEMRALIWTTLLGEKVEYDMEKGRLFYTKNSGEVEVGESK
jgi:hypothetical protein